ncbi:MULTISPECIES: cupredoxin family copper-binding protein [unclassified Methanoregula]|uniref:cupredoxin domain-containing protein n=1 Tax=unclassified Methanoregula TaxID=2649730 RepID=UPI0009D28D45|nr:MULTISPECIES: cupredoxin family copper-binding protein [unclassified Methanoregula]OPX61772.1 MAG: Halocyanin precursor [Methanoregula sp. PtaB.Bin085]OPY33919.1 MAG: Halocyanin precursor [Methanoregula sp. PtaU1.Bin006]
MQNQETREPGLHRAYTVAGILLLIAACMVAGCSSGKGPATPALPQPPAGSGNAITIQNFAFDPPALTVKAGTVVMWTNQDSAPHAIVSDTGSPETFSSDTLSTGRSYSFTFNRPGTYPYHCSIHPSMTGTIVVEK